MERVIFLPVPDVENDIEMNTNTCEQPLRVTTDTGKSAKGDQWPRKIRLGRVTVTVYRRRTPGGNFGYMVANYGNGERRLDSYATETEAIEAANHLARQLSQRDVIAASMTREQSVEYAAAMQTLQPLGISLTAAASTIAEAVKFSGDLSGIVAATKFCRQRKKQITNRPVADVVAELLKVKEFRGASTRYLQDLRLRLGRFVAAVQKDICNVTTKDIQEWLDSRKLSAQTYENNRRVLNLLFEFAKTRGYAADNPVQTVERVKVRKNGDVLIFTPAEITKLLTAASREFLPCLAIAAFAGLRSAEIERQDWKDIDLIGRHIIVRAGDAKTASRRIIPIQDNLAAWLAPYSGSVGKVWTRKHDAFYDAEQKTAKSSGLKWKKNALRHSYTSYRLAQTQNVGQVALECGTSQQVIFKYYRELVKPADAQLWFNVTPESQANVIVLVK